MSYKVEFAGVSLSEYCTVLNVNRSILPQRTNYSKSIPTMNGSLYTGYHYGERIISLDIFLKGETKEKYIENVRNLARVLNVENPSKLVISDEPDKYVYAVLTDSTDLTRSVSTGSATIQFICHDPVVYSDNWKTFMPNERKIITINNTGTMPANPFIDVTFKNKACFFQATDKSGKTILIGTPKEIGKATTSNSDIVVDDNCRDASHFTTLPSSLLDNDKNVNGGTFGVGFNGNGIVTLDYGTGENTWHGSAFRKSLGTDLSEFQVEIDVVFSSQGQNYEPPKPVPTPPQAPPQTGNTCLGTYKVVNCGGLWINQDPNTSRPLYAMAPGTLIYPTEISGGWVKHTHSNRWNTFTGWSSLKYLQKVSDNGRARTVSPKASVYAEEQLGIMEIYGFDKSGTKLFKAELSDTNQYFESVEPRMFISNTEVLKDEVLNKTARKDTDGNAQASGAVGRWNDLTGKIIIRREKNSKGEFLWNFTVNKYENGKLIETLQTTNSLISSNYPKGNLSYLGFYIAGHDTKEVVSIMAITNVKVKKINYSTDATIKNNLTLFEPEDHLQVDFASGEVLLNGINIATEIDIGSIFFNTPVGESEIIIRSDDTEMIGCCGIREKFL